MCVFGLEYSKTIVESATPEEQSMKPSIKLLAFERNWIRRFL
jgi:hypothetical protein